MIVSYCIASSLINVITSIVLGIFVLGRNPRDARNRTYFLFTLSIALWSLFYYQWLYETTYERALFFVRLLNGAAAFIPIFYLHHLFTFLKPDASKNFILKLCYGFGFWALWANTTPHFIPGVSAKLVFPFWPDVGPLYHVYLFLWFMIIFYGEWLVFNAMRKSSGNLRDQLRLILLGTLVGYAGGCTNFFLSYNILIPPYGNILVSFYVVATAYAIVRHRFLDITVVIKKTVVFTGLAAFVYCVFTASAFLVQEVLTTYLDVRGLWSYALSIVLIVLGYDPIRSLLVNLTDHVLFQKKYDYQKILKDASRGMSQIQSLEKLMQLVVHFVTMKMRVKNAAVLTLKTETADYVLGYERGYKRTLLDYRVPEASYLIQYLLREKEAVDLERVKECLAQGSRKKGKDLSPHSYDFASIKLQMEELEASCCVPSFLSGNLRNVLILGEKKSGDYYTDEDLNVLFTLAQESAIAIENARLYDEAIKKTAELEKINHQLEYSKDLLMKALRETEVANKQLQDTQAQLIHEQKMATLGRLAASVGHEVNNPLTILSMNVSRAILKYRKEPELKIKDILDIFQKMEQNIGRIKAVVNTLTGLLKKSEKGTFEPLSLKLILEETLPLVQFQTYLDNLTGTEVEFDIPGSIPLIRGDLERLQEVFLNLFINAYHAMGGKRHRQIHVTADIDPENGQRVAVHFTDNGSGMSEDVIKKIFNYGFTTKPPGKGSGMGLYMCKYIVELHGGDMKVKSKVGEGTTFTLTLPIYEEAGTDVGGLRIQAST